MYIAKLRGDLALQNLALASYPTALRHFSSELMVSFDSPAKQMKQKQLLALINMSLLLFEVGGYLCSQSYVTNYIALWIINQYFIVAGTPPWIRVQWPP